MKFNGSYKINTTQQKLWDFVISPEKVSQCFPGIKEIKKENDQYKVTGRISLGVIKGDYSATFKYVDLKPTTHLGISARGSGMGGSVDLVAQMDMVGETPVETTWEADLKVGGVLASLASRFMDSVGGKLVNELFECIKMKVE